MRFRKLIAAPAESTRANGRLGRGQRLYAGLREAVQRCRDDDDTPVAYEDFERSTGASPIKASSGS